MDGRPWSDLPSDILCEISSRICAPAEFVYFHLVCKPWRASRDPLSRSTTTTQFLPWLLSPVDKESTHPRFRCIFSKSSCHVMPPRTVAAQNWVSSCDGTHVWYLTVEHLRPTLHDPFTGELTDLPLFPDDIIGWEEENPRGVIYGDGTTFFYNIWYVGDTVRFRAAVLRLGSDVWTVVERTLQAPKHGSFCAAYHCGKIMLTVEATLWRIVSPECRDQASDMLVPRPPFTCWKTQYYSREYSYVLEYRGELLWASVNIYTYQYYCHRKVERELSMTVHVLEVEATSRENKTRWVKKDACSLADMVLFLGTPNSFAVDASRLGGRHGGCAFFVYHDNEALPWEKVGVFSYNLVSDKSNFFERLPRGWNDERCTWHVIQPAIAPIQDLMKARAVNKQRLQETTLVMDPTLNIHIRRHYEASFAVTVCNLPLMVKSSQLQLFLSEHGKVSKAKVLNYKKTKRSQGIAEVTMSTLHANQEDALDALNELYLDGYNLDVRLVKKGRQRLRGRCQYCKRTL